MKCDVDIRKELCENIVLTGGTTMFPFLEDRRENIQFGLEDRFFLLL